MDHWKTSAPITHAETAKGGRQFVWGMAIFLVCIPLTMVALRTWFYPWLEAREKIAQFEGGPERTFTLHISGMECAMCAVHIEETLGKLPGVKSINADDEAGTCTIVTNAKDTGLLAASIADTLSKTNKYAVVDPPPASGGSTPSTAPPNAAPTDSPASSPNPADPMPSAAETSAGAAASR